MATSTEEAEGDPEYDNRRPEDVRYDAIADQIRDTTALVRQMAETVQEFTEGGKGITQRVIYKTEGMGSIGIVCACVCVLCVIFLVIVVIFVDGKLSAIEAWQGVFGRDLTAIHTKIDHPKEKDH